MEKYIEKVYDNQLFEGLDLDEITKVLNCSNARVESFEDGQTVFLKDDIIKNIGIVIEGEFNLVSQKFNGTRVIVTTLEANDMFGEALIFSTATRSPYDLVSLGKSKALLIPKLFFINICPAACGFHNKIISNMLSILSDKIIMLNNKMKILNAESIKSKIAIYLINIYNKNNKMIFDMPMKRQELSEFLGVTRPSLSREFSNMQKEGIIDIYRSSVKIVDLEKLYELTE